jgi:hypothetical protein
MSATDREARVLADLILVCNEDPQADARLEQAPAETSDTDISGGTDGARVRRA